MPVYGFPDRGSYDRTRDAVRKVNREFPARKRTPTPLTDVPPRSGFFGRTITALPQGVLVDYKVERHKGPAHGIDSDPTEVDVHYAQVPIPIGTWVWCQKVEGKVYVAPFVCTEPEEEP